MPAPKDRFTDALYYPPDSEIEAFARVLYPAIREYFESEQGQQEFAQWKHKQELERKINNIK